MRAKRTFSDGFIQRQIAKVDALHEQNRAESVVLPSPDDSRPYSMLYQTCRAVANNRRRCGYVDGFWMGFTLASHARSEAAEGEVTG